MLVQASSRYQKYSLFGNSRVIPINWGHADFREQPGVPRGVRAGCFYPYGVRKRNGPRESTQQVHWLQDGERLLAAAHWLEDVSILRKSGIYRKSDCQPLRFLFLHAVLHFLSFISYPFETKILSQTQNRPRDKNNCCQVSLEKTTYFSLFLLSSLSYYYYHIRVYENCSNNLLNLTLNDRDLFNSETICSCGTVPRKHFVLDFGVLH